MSQYHQWPGAWTRTAPKVEDHVDGAELVWVVRGHPFTRPIVARSSGAVRISDAGKASRVVRVELMADGMDGRDVSAYRWFAGLEWRGPLLIPGAWND